MQNNRRHYRVAQKNIELTEKGCYLTPGQKQKVTCLAAGLGVILFLQGLLIGVLIGRSCHD